MGIYRSRFNGMKPSLPVTFLLSVLFFLLLAGGLTAAPTVRTIDIVTDELTSAEEKRIIRKANMFP